MNEETNLIDKKEKFDKLQETVNKFSSEFADDKLPKLFADNPGMEEFEKPIRELLEAHKTIVSIGVAIGAMMAGASK